MTTPSDEKPKLEIDLSVPEVVQPAPQPVAEVPVLEALKVEEAPVIEAIKAAIEDMAPVAPIIMPPEMMAPPQAPKKTKFACLCQGGNVRSVSMAFALKNPHAQDALSCSWESNTKETLDMIFKWADYIIIMQSIFKEKVPSEYQSKVRIVDVGPDNYGTPMHPSLLGFLAGVSKEWAMRQFKI